MNRIATLAAASLVTAFAFAAPAGAQEQQAPGMAVCQGIPFDNTYVMLPNPSFAPLTAEQFNNAAQEQLVGALNQLGGGYLQVIPEKLGGDCEDFMQKLKDTGMVDNIAPNWIVGPAMP